MVREEGKNWLEQVSTKGSATPILYLHLLMPLCIAMQAVDTVAAAVRCVNPQGLAALALLPCLWGVELGLLASSNSLAKSLFSYIHF